jgi:hypothetical protein
MDHENPKSRHGRGCRCEAVAFVADQGLWRALGPTSDDTLNALKNLRHAKFDIILSRNNRNHKSTTISPRQGIVTMPAPTAPIKPAEPPISSSVETGKSDQRYKFLAHAMQHQSIFPTLKRTMSRNKSKRRTYPPRPPCK